MVEASTSMRIFSSMVTDTPMRPEQLDHGGDVLQMRHVRDRHRAVGQQAARQNRQGRVLGARNADLALERDAAVDLQLIHVRLPCVFFRREHLQRERMNLVAHRRRRAWRTPVDGAARRACRRTPARSPRPRNAHCPRSSPARGCRPRPVSISCATCCGFMPSPRKSAQAYPVSFAR